MRSGVLAVLLIVPTVKKESGGGGGALSLTGTHRPATSGGLFPHMSKS